MKTVKMTLDPKSISDGIKELKAIRRNINNKLDVFVETLVQGGVKIASLCVASTSGDSDLPDVDYEINDEGDIIRATISLVGHDALFVEFGAGIAYNTGKQHPLASEFGYGPGTFPSEHPPNKAINPGYWYYSDRDSAGGKVSKKSIGTEASMPLYHAAENVRNEYIKKAVEIFRSS